MKKIFFVGNFRGFFRHLIENPPNNVEYILNSKSIYYEKNSTFKMMLKKIFSSKLGDYLGLILSLNLKKIDNNKYLCIQTYNRFIKGNIDYVITLENPTALYHYCLNRKNTYFGRKKLKYYLKKKNLKALVCISKACESTARILLNDYIGYNLRILQIYPYIPNNRYINDNTFDMVYKKEFINCLFITSQFGLKSGYEIIEAFKKLENKKIKLTIISDKNNINKDTIKKIEKMDNIKLLDFNLQYNELEKIYAENDILLHPTRQDSFALVVLEAIKAGLAVLATDLYAIPEMVEDGKNGYLVDCKFYFFNKKDNLPNPKVWNNRKKTIYNNYLDENIINFIVEKLLYLYERRDILRKFRINSFEKSKNENFSEESIKNKWEILYKTLSKEV